MAGRCEECGAEVDMPFDCKFCEGRYCGRHRLPEKHDCRGLVSHKERLREEGRLMHQPGKAVEPSTPSQSSGVGGAASGLVDRTLRFLEGRAALVFLGIMAGVFFMEVLVQSYSVALFETLFVLGPDFYWKPWTLVTSVFAHGGTGHLFANGIVLFFFGPTVERLIGTRRFVALFLGAGIAAGVAQVAVFAYLLPGLAQSGPLAATLQAIGLTGSQTGVVGASGAIMGILGTLTLLAPNTTVLLFFFLPAPLWLVTIGYAFYDLSGIFFGGGNVAHLAHLAGLAIGLWYGRELKDQGLGRQLRQGGLGGAGPGGGGGGGAVRIGQQRR